MSRIHGLPKWRDPLPAFFMKIPPYFDYLAKFEDQDLDLNVTLSIFLFNGLK